MPDAKIKVLIIDNSRSVLDLLRHILNSDPQIEVIGTAENGIQALKFLEKNRPDVITLDMEMPGEAKKIGAGKFILSRLRWLQLLSIS